MWKKMLLDELEIFLTCIGIAAIVTIGWQLLEIAMIGEIIPSKVDNVIVLILTLSLYGNLRSANKNTIKS